MLGAIKKMKLLLYILLISVFSSCSEQTSEAMENSAEDSSSDSTTYTPLKLIQFPDYNLTHRDTIINTWEEGGKSEFINLGQYVSSTTTFDVLTEFSLIPVADGLRGKNRLYLVSNESDTSIYEADDRAYLPVDIYKNHFVFRNEMDQYVFVKAEVIDEEIMAFSYGWNKCLLN